MTALATTKPRAGELITADQATAIRTALKTSLYPGASDESVEMVLAYCQAAGYDPMKKPVHIVPMKVSTGRKDANGWDIKETRDVVMPGIGQYRTDAVRTEQYAGCSEPEFGPTKVLEFKRERWVDGQGGRRQRTFVDDSIEYPEWCRVTVTKIVGGSDRQFTAKEFWLENYAEKGDDGAPNAMWEKRPFAQLAKCTEAQALRKAFPDTVSAAPTADEMEGKTMVIEGQIVQQAAPAIAAQVELPFYAEADFTANLPKWRDIIASGKRSADDLISMLQTKAKFTPDQLDAIRAPVAEEGHAEAPAEASQPNEYWPDEALSEQKA